MAVAFALFGSLGLQTQDFERGIQKSRSELQQFVAASNQGALQLQGFTRALGGLAAGALSLNALKSGLESIVRTGIDMERLRQSFTAITGSAETARTTFEFIRGTANRLGLDFQGLADQYRGLAAAARGTAMEGKATQELFLAVANASRAFGLSSAETGRALTALQQIMSKGKVAQEEIRGQLGEALPGASQIAARAFGVTTQQFDKMVEKGLDAIPFLKRFTVQLGKEVPAAADQAGSGFTRFANAVIAAKDNIAQRGVVTFFEKMLAPMTGAIEKFNKLEEQSRVRARGVVGPMGESLATSDEMRRIALNMGELSAIGDSRRVADQARAQRLRQEIETINASVQARAEAQGAVEGSNEEFVRRSAERRQEMERQAQERLEQGRKVLQDFQKDLVSINEQAKMTPTLFDKNKEVIDAANKRAKELREVFGGKALPAEMATAFQTMEQQAGAAQSAIDAVAEAERRAKEEAAAQERMAEGRATVEYNREQEAQQALDSFLKSKRDELDLLVLTTEQIENNTLAELELANNSAKTNKALLERLQFHRQINDAIEASKRTTQEAAQVTAQAQKLSADFGSFEARELDVRKKLSAQAFKDQKDMVKDFADFFMESIVNASDIASKGFKAFADSVIADLQRIMIRRFLAPAMENWIGLGLQALGLVAGGVSVPDSAAGALNLYQGGITATPDWTSPDLSITPSMVGGRISGGISATGGVSGLQSGGPMMPGKFYMVGEGGPELVYSGQGGHVYPHGQGPGGPVVNVTIQTPDAQSFQRSSAEWSYKIGRAVQQAQRNM